MGSPNHLLVRTASILSCLFSAWFCFCASFLAFVETCLAVCIVFIYLGVCKKYVQTTQGFDFCGNQKNLYSIGKAAFCKKFLCVIEIVFFVEFRYDLCIFSKKILLFFCFLQKQYNYLINNEFGLSCWKSAVWVVEGRLI